MSPRRTRRGTIRESDVSVNTTLKSASKPNRSNRRTNKSHLGKSSEEDDSILGSHSVANITTTSVLDSSTTNVRTRKRRGPEISIPDSSLSITIDESKTKSQTRRKKANSKQEQKSIKVQKLDSSLISEDGSFIEKKKKDEKRVSYSIDHLISEDEEVSTITTKKRGQSKKKDPSPNKKVCKTPESSSPQKTNVVPLDGRVTPKSSPLKDFPLTPHRSTKTPKKSPENLGSPKTHTRDSLQLLNVSRKLSIAISPVSSDRSSVTLQKSDSPKINKSAKQTSTSQRSSKSILKPSPSKNKSISPSTKKSRFSKSPKKVLETTQSKSKKSNKKTSPKRVSISIPRVPKKEFSKTLEDTLLESGKTLKVDSPSKSRSLKTKGVSDLESTSNVTSPSPVKSAAKLNSPSKSRNVSKSVSPKKSKKSEPSPKKISSTINVTASNTSIKDSSPSKSRKSDCNVSLVDLKKSPKIILADLSKISLGKSPEVTPLSKSKASPKFPSTSKAETSLVKTSKVTPSAKLKVTPSSHSKVSKVVKRVLSSSKSKKSPKVISPLSASKMPKIVLNLKTKKLPSKFFRTSTPSRGKKSPSKSPKTPKPSQTRKSVVTSSKTPTYSKATKSPVKSSNTPAPSKTKKSPKSKSPKKDVSMNPRIVVTKLSSPKKKSLPVAAKTNQPIVNLVPVDHKASGGKTPKPLSRLSSKNLTPLDILEKKHLILKTSTPREKIKRLLNLSSHRKGLYDKKNSASTRSPSNKSKIIKKLDKQSKLVADQQFLEDESEPSLNESSLIHMSDVFDSDTSQKDNTLEAKKSESSPSKKKVNKSQDATANGSFETKKNSSNSPTKDKTVQNNTYELENPKTPGLRMKSNKRTLNDAELTVSDELESKRNCKVTFASPSRNQARSSSINRIGTPGHAILRKNTPMSTNKVKTPNSRVSVSRIDHRRSLSTSNIKTPVNALVNRRRSNSLSDTASKSRKSDHASQIASVNRLSRPRVIINSEKKSALKGTSAKKIPNFAEIHQKNFSKMESIVDAKKRVEKRHITLNTGPSSTKKVDPSNLRGSGVKTVPPNASNGYNRFGFKMRKNDAVDMVSKKQVGNVDTREKKRADARTVLKGVRMNKRFELQMKARLKTS